MISVVIPLYNKEKSIRATLESVCAQTYTDWECIVVDDGSTDNSVSVVESIIAKCKMSNVKCKIQLFSKPNGGVSSARNFGIKKSRGEYVAFLDGDDIWDKDFLKTMVELIEEYPGKSVYGLGCEQIRRGEKPLLENSYYRGEATWDYATMAFTGSSACVNKADAMAVGLFDTRMTHGEDLDMWWRLMLLHGGASDLRPYAYYIQDAENRAMHREAPLEKHIPYYIDKYACAREKDPKFHRFFDREMIYRLYPYLFIKQYRKEARQLAKKLDYSQLKGTMHFRMLFPYIYRIYQKMTGK
jgi:glycosyltransferase involved in cell wall biosynthesis